MQGLPNFDFTWRGAAAFLDDPESASGQREALDLMSTVYRVNVRYNNITQPLERLIVRRGPNDVREHAYRWDRRHYDDIFQYGFKRRERLDSTPIEQYYNVESHIRYGGKPTDPRNKVRFGFVSTTVNTSWRPSLPDIDEDEELGDTRTIYCYEVYAPGGIGIKETFGERYLYPVQNEVAFIKGIAPRYIRGATAHTLSRDRRFPRCVRKNKIYYKNEGFNHKFDPKKETKILRPQKYYYNENNKPTPLIIQAIPRVSPIVPPIAYPALDLNDITASLPKGLTWEERAALLDSIKIEHDQLEAKLFEEREYQKLYAALYSKTGAVEVDGAKEEDAMDHKTDNTEKGVPEFWLNALKNNKITAEVITERDEEALKYLKDIKWCRMDDPKGFKLEFFFETNPFFTNSILTKLYHMIDELVMEKAIGTTIEWLPGKCLTTKLLKKKPKKGSKNAAAKPITNTEEDCESFFNFFSPPEFPHDALDIEKDAAEELQNQMEQDYDVGSTIRDKIIPHAVSWFTREANQEDFGGFDDEEKTETKKKVVYRETGDQTEEEDDVKGRF